MKISNKSRKSFLNPDFVRAGASPIKTGKRGKLESFEGMVKRAKLWRLLFLTFYISPSCTAIFFCPWSFRARAYRMIWTMCINASFMLQWAIEILSHRSATVESKTGEASLEVAFGWSSGCGAWAWLSAKCSFRRAEGWDQKSFSMGCCMLKKWWQSVLFGGTLVMGLHIHPWHSSTKSKPGVFCGKRVNIERPNSREA